MVGGKCWPETGTRSTGIATSWTVFILYCGHSRLVLYSTWVVEWTSSIIVRSSTSRQRRALYQQRRPSVMAVGHTGHVSQEKTPTHQIWIWSGGAGSATWEVCGHTRPTLFNRSTSTGRRKLHPGSRVQSTGTYAAVDKHNGPVNYVTPSGAVAGPDRRRGGRTGDRRRRRLRVLRRRRNMEIMLIYDAAIASGRHEAVMEE